MNKHVGGTGTTLSTLNKRYWLLGGRREVGKNLAKCTPCRRNNARPKPQEMAPLPRCRVHSRKVKRITTIHKTGIDVAGPFKVNLGRGSATRKKSETKHNCKFCERLLHLQTVLDNIWPQLHCMNKWTTQRDIQVGDIVAVLENKSRGVWPIGKIVDVFPSNKDHHISRAQVKCKNKVIDRSLSKLMVIQEAPPQV